MLARFPQVLAAAIASHRDNVAIDNDMKIVINSLHQVVLHAQTGS